MWLTIESCFWLQDRWEATEEKPVAIAIAIGALVGLYALNGIVGSVEKIPIFGFLFEVVGILVTGWFAYRYLVFESDRYTPTEYIHWLV